MGLGALVFTLNAKVALKTTLGHTSYTHSGAQKTP